ncbi:MAG: tRNA (N6-isopentenyl adenosine(37)-C2)-methylthiotransferase MiaB [Cyclobacteriaceae bacterium]|nr:tRNA (N6-isopentenyl adenosine(37)-C2)-methylthiotransferase MiaB [Cyclobacteriaceae bacterium]
MENLIREISIIGKQDPGKEKIGVGRKLYIESYGCQMNFSDSEIVSSIMQKEGFHPATVFEDADLIFINTCSIREKAETTVRRRLAQFNALKRKKPGLLIGVLGCMAERLKTRLLEEEKIVDLVVGPDAYRDLPKLVRTVDEGQKAVNTFLSREETYADISPVRLNSNGITAFISIMRGCDNMCSFCVVPYTRGRERSRDPYTIVEEASALFHQGYREVTLLGQNVDSYKWSFSENNKARLENQEHGEIYHFSDLLKMVAGIHPGLRIRFSTSHPKDITDEVLHTIKSHENICDYIHLPAQSGNSRILELMNRTYSREWYMERIRAIREILGKDCGISSDWITGFCTETEEEHQDTLSLMESVKFDFSYMFAYSERPGTPAARKLADDVPGKVKKRRLQEIIIAQKKHSLERNLLDVNKYHKVLIEGFSKRSDEHLQGRNAANKVVVFPAEKYKKGQYVNVFVDRCTGGTLLGTVSEVLS